MILGDSLQVMASLAERENLRGQVQCIYIDPPYGIGFNSNFQWSTTSRNVQDRNVAHITREPEQVKAFRDTWRDGIHSYLTYLRDRLTVARDLLTDSGSIFVQIGDENVHRVRTLMDEVFGDGNFAALIFFLKTTGKGSTFLDPSGDYLLWYAKNAAQCKVRPTYKFRSDHTLEQQYNMASLNKCDYRRLSRKELRTPSLIPHGYNRFMPSSVYSDSGGATTSFTYQYEGKAYEPMRGYYWRTTNEGFDRLSKAARLCVVGNYIRYRMYGDDYPIVRVTNYWDDVRAGGFGEAKIFVVQTTTDVVQRCVLMTTDPGDLVLDPTCGSGTTAYAAEQWGRRWITIDTSRVSLTLARTRIMGARYPYYLLADSPEGQRKEAELLRREITETSTYCNVRQGFVYERVPHVTLRDIANNSDIDVIYDQFQQEMEPIRAELNSVLETEWEEWEIPREPGEPWPEGAVAAWHQLGDSSRDDDKAELLRTLNRELGRDYTLNSLPTQPRDPWVPEATELHERWWELRIARQKEIDASIGANADFEYLFDRPYTDNHKVRVAGPFTVESLSPHRMITSDDDDDREIAEARSGYRSDGDVPGRDFATLMLDNLRTSGVQQAQKSGKIDFVAITGWPGEYICAEGLFMEGNGEDAVERRAGIFIGPEFGTVTRPNLTGAAREAAEAGFDLLIACAFSYDAHATELDRVGVINVLKARMNADLHMADTLKEDSKGNLFVVFGEPDIEVEDAGQDSNGEALISIKIHGVDIFNPATGQVQSDDTDGIACWFVDTDYNEESFFVRQAYFLGASNDPYKSLKTTLKAEVDEEAWNTLRSDTSRPFPKPGSGRVAVKVINHLGDEAMKVLTVR